MHRLTIFATAFRIFFFACAVHAAAVIAIWILRLRGIDAFPINNSPVSWHTYEMVFGFCRAAIFGFLFTAGQHWAGKQLTGSKALVVLFFLWLLGRFAFFLPPILSSAAFTADLAANLFALYCLRPLIRTRQKTNHGVFFLFITYTMAQAAAFAANAMPQLQSLFLHSVHFGLIVVVLFVAVIAGRILPFFAGVVMQHNKPRIVPRIEAAVLPLGFLALIIYAVQPLHPVMEKWSAAIFALNALLHAVRWWLWRPFSSARFPILVILYAGYFWLVAGFVMLPLAGLGFIASSPVWHVFGIGAAGVFIFGMMTRVALGHTGRPIKASLLVVGAYFFINAAVLARVLMPFAGKLSEAYIFAAVFWLTAFGAFLFMYTPILFGPRSDGKPG